MREYVETNGARKLSNYGWLVTLGVALTALAVQWGSLNARLDNSEQNLERYLSEVRAHVEISGKQLSDLDRRLARIEGRYQPATP